MGQQTPPRVLLIGDSITHGNDWQSAITFAAVTNIAVPGFATDDVMGQLRTEPARMSVDVWQRSPLRSSPELPKRNYYSTSSFRAAAASLTESTLRTVYLHP